MITCIVCCLDLWDLLCERSHLIHPAHRRRRMADDQHLGAFSIGPLHIACMCSLTALLQKAFSFLRSLLDPENTHIHTHTHTHRHTHTYTHTSTHTHGDTHCSRPLYLSVRNFTAVQIQAEGVRTSLGFKISYFFPACISSLG